MNNDEITRIALDTGFKPKEQPDGSMALNPYVFDFARKLLAAAPIPPEVDGLKPEDFDTPKDGDIADLLDDHAINEGHPADWPYATRLMQEAARLIRALQASLEVEPAAYEIRFVGGLITPMLWLKVPVSEYEEMKDKPEWEGRKLYTSPPFPKADEVVAHGCESNPVATKNSGNINDKSPKVEEVDLLKAEINRLYREESRLLAAIKELKTAKASWDADGNPLNLEAAARDALSYMSFDVFMPSGGKRAFNNLHKFLGES
jgi:hypothetical protein